MRNNSKTAEQTEQTRWMLGGEAPGPHVEKPRTPVEIDDLRNGDTHTGTDPLGRAIGPAESHLHVKRIRDADGEIVDPKPGKGHSIRQAEARARKVAEATDTRPEAVDNPTPILPAQVAALHGEGSRPLEPTETD